MASATAIQPAAALRKILFATDFSPTSQSALPLAATLARTYGSHLFLVHIISRLAFVFPQDPDSSRRELHQQAEEEMDRLLQLPELVGLPHTDLVEDGRTVEALARIIEERQIDLLVLGTHGRRGMKHLLLGSVAEDVLRRAGCPVLTISPRAARATTAPRHILCPVDFSSVSLGGLPHALSFARQWGAKLTLMNVLEGDWPGPDSPASIAETCAVKRLRELLPPDAYRDLRIDYAARFGEPADALLYFAQHHDVDLIVMGVRGVAAFYSAQPGAGPIAYHIVSSAPCPVLTVRA